MRRAGRRATVGASAKAALLAFAAFAGASAVAASRADAGWWDDAGAARRATLDDLRSQSERWRDVPVILEIRFARTAEPGNPYFTRFTSHGWRAASAWTRDFQPRPGVALPEAYSRFFVARGSAAEQRFAGLRQGDRVEIRAVVRDVVAGEPWIEVLSVTGDGDSLTPEEAAQVRRADGFLANDNAPAAEAIYRAVLATRTLPAALRADLHRKVGETCWRTRRFADSADALAKAVEIEPGDSATQDRLLRARDAVAQLAATEKSAAAQVGRDQPKKPASMGAPLPEPVPVPEIVREATRRLSPPGGLVPAAPAAASDDPPPPPPPPANPAVQVPDPVPVEEPAPPPPPPAKPKLLGPR